jgi:signal peptidase I
MTANNASKATVEDAKTAKIITGTVDHDAQMDEAGTPAPRSVKDMAIDEAKELFSVVGVALVLMVLFRTFLFQPFTIPSASMEPNLYEGDYIIVSKWNYGYSKYSSVVPLPFIKDRIFGKTLTRGDIIVFKLPSDTKIDYIKRVVGLPGDRIQMRGSKLYINDELMPYQPVGETYAPKDMLNADTPATLVEETFDGKTHKIQDMVLDGRVDDTDVYVVPAGYYFMMGDNRDNSEDSRFPAETGGVGFVPAENIEGKATIVLMSWKSGASLWKPWTWLNFRWDRFFKPLH